MFSKLSVAAAIGLMVGATSLEAQIVPRPDGRDRGDRTGDRVTTVGDVLEAARRRAGVYDDGTTSRESRGTRIPKGHLPPRGMCRVWIDGVPPGHQPAPTNCAQAERDRFQYSNARVIHGDRESFPGKGKGKWGRDRDDDDVLRDGGILRDGRIPRADDDDRHQGRGKGKSKAKGRGKNG